MRFVPAPGAARTAGAADGAAGPALEGEPPGG
jgi:hypothetical protein